MKKPRGQVRIGGQVFGYQLGLRQYSRMLHLPLPRLGDFHEEDAKSYLQEKLEFGTDETYQVRKLPGVQLEGAAETFLAMCTQVARHLLQSASMPAFEEELVFSCDQNAHGVGRANVSLFIPTTRNASVPIASRAYYLGLCIVSEFTKPKFKRRDLKDLTQEQAYKFVRKTREAHGGGYSAKAILKEAFDRDIPMMNLGWGYYQLGMGAKATVYSASATFADSMLGAHLANSKWRTVKYLQQFGVPVPNSHLARNVSQANEISEKVGFPLVVKPVDCERGEGVTVDILSSKELHRAFQRAEKLSRDIMVENRIPGICHRLLIYRGKCVFGFSRHPVSVVGDGKSTISELIQAERKKQLKKARHLTKKMTLLDDQTNACLKDQGFDASTILGDEQIAHLRPYQSDIWGGHNDIVTEKIHPANIELACRTTRLFGLETAGIDMISDDITKPWYETGAVINEVNYKPQVADNTARAFMDINFSEDKGRIPVECFVGDDDALQAALARQADLCSQGISAFVTSNNHTYDSEENEIFFNNLNGLFQRVEQILVDVRADVAIAVVHDDELAHLGRPVREFSEITVVNQRITSPNSATGNVDSEQFARLMRMLKDES